MKLYEVLFIIAGILLAPVWGAQLFIPAVFIAVPYFWLQARIEYLREENKEFFYRF